MNMKVDESKYDAILVVQQRVDERNTDKRMSSTGGSPSGGGWGSQTGFLDYYGPEVYGSMSFGHQVARSLGSNNGYGVEVSDFGAWCVVRVTYNSVPTGRSASKTFLIVFQDKSKGIVLSTSNKWRTIDGWSQAVSYISSSMSAVRSNCDSVL